MNEVWINLIELNWIELNWIGRENLNTANT